MLNLAKSLCNNNGDLLLLTKYGSHLYGTNTPESDTDYKGVYLPNKKDLILQKKIKTLEYTTKNKIHSKNTKDDIDLQIWPLHHFLYLLELADTNAIDLLFSFTNKEGIIYIDDRIKYMIDNASQFVDIKNNKAYISYVYKQAKKYGMKGSRLGIVKEILTYLKDNNLTLSDEKLFTRIEEIDEKFHDDAYCFIDNILIGKNKSIRSLNIIGKIYQETISFKYMYFQLKASYDRYGQRAKDARLNKNVDWKAVSHAVRCLYQIKELIDTKSIQFPLKKAEFLKDIKAQKYTWQEIENIIIDEINIVEKDIFVLEENNIKPNIEKLLLDIYKL
jgi:predicted nucleotidyltransferase